MSAFLKWLGESWKDIISVVFSATGIGIAVVTLRSADKRNKQEARSKKVAEFLDRCQRFVQGYIDFANSQEKIVFAIEALQIQLDTLAMGVHLLEGMNGELHGNGSPLEKRFEFFAKFMEPMFSEYFTMFRLYGAGTSDAETAFKEYQSKVGYQAKALMTAVDE